MRARDLKQLRKKTIRETEEFLTRRLKTRERGHEMKARKIYIMLAVLMLAAVGVLNVQAAEAPKRPLIQIAILLDNSGSMSGLIQQAKTQLWQMVNEFIRMKREGLRPEIQVALYTYGNPPPRLILALTNDLDKVSEQLFAVGISGGTEYCGQVIKTAVDELKWSEAKDDLKVIFIAGNEPFTQGTVDYRESCKVAITKGIIVNTIHCGGEAEGINGKWQDGALLADGKFMCIDQNRAVVSITAPQDPELAKLGVELNATYVPYGRLAAGGSANQSAQDANAAAVSAAVSATRAVTKGSSSYRNSDWDLVDAVQEGKVKLAEVKAEDLPENMKKMDAEARKTYVDSQQTKRAEIQAKIKVLAEARRQHVEEEMKKRGDQETDSLGGAMMKVVREQAAEKNMKSE